MLLIKKESSSEVDTSHGVQSMQCISRKQELDHKTSSHTHVKRETKIKKLFVCLLCSKELCSATNIYRHLHYVHRVSKANRNVHYLDNTNLHKKQHELLYKKCFPDYL